jgi:hypothetical protein
MIVILKFKLSLDVLANSWHNSALGRLKSACPLCHCFAVLFAGFISIVVSTVLCDFQNHQQQVVRKHQLLMKQHQFNLRP